MKRVPINVNLGFFAEYDPEKEDLNDICEVLQSVVENALGETIEGFSDIQTAVDLTSIETESFPEQGTELNY